MEEWRDIKGYEGMYQVSDKGRVRSLDREVYHYASGRQRIKGRMLRTCDGNTRYIKTSLSKDGGTKCFPIHQLVAIAFLGHIPNGPIDVVNHINEDRSDNSVSNLEVVTSRQNAIAYVSKREYTSIYTGVHYYPTNKTWIAQIVYNGAKVALGSHKTELEASNAYQSALSKIEDGTFNPSDYKRKCRSKYKGVGQNKYKSWTSIIYIKGKRVYLGSFKTELEAHEAYQKALLNPQQ